MKSNKKFVLIIKLEIAITFGRIVIKNIATKNI